MIACNDRAKTSSIAMNTVTPSPTAPILLKDRILAVDWIRHTQQLSDLGYTIIPGLLTDEECREMIGLYGDPRHFRKTVNMARHRFGIGEYKYFRYDLPSILQTVRTYFYPPLSDIANAWNRMLHIDHLYPSTHEELIDKCRVAGQLLPTALILKYESGGYNTLHQDLYGDVYFPMQTVFLLNNPDVDFSGGEFVLVEQVPRAQSRAIVLRLGKGDSLIFTTRFRPEKGSRGYYRVQVRHGVSDVHQGNRYSMGVIFHDATS
jgi:uncharacterized protein